MNRLIQKYPHLLAMLTLFLLGALSYLPLAHRFGFYNDDWYLMYAARVFGPEVFETIFASDRPARAPMQYVLYILFGENLIYYHLSAYLFRTMSALALYFTLQTFWQGNRRISLLSAGLFLIYPGFLSQVNAVDFQAHIFSLMMAMLSIFLTIKAVFADKTITRFLLGLFAILTGWVYMALMEYYVGLEAFRFALLAGLAIRQHTNLRQRMVTFFHTSIAFVLAPSGFLIWRIFIFESDRRATDVGAQVSQLFASPTTGVWWLIYLLQDTINVVLMAWFVPLYNLVFDLRLRDFLFAVFLGAASTLFFLIILKILPKTEERAGWQKETLLIGLFSVLGGLFPVILANRSLNFTDFSRYTIPALAGGILILTVILLLLRTASAQNVAIAFLVFSAVMTHTANSVSAVEKAEATRNFWWQVYWRASGFQPETTLAVDYPNTVIQEDYFVWGPANLIYANQPQSGQRVRVPIQATVINADNIKKIVLRRGQDEQMRRGIRVLTDYRNILVVTQAATNTCARILDGQMPELSEKDSTDIMLIAPNSQIDFVLIDQNQPPPHIFMGAEPPHTWCYYYQKASLARQQKDWHKVIDIYAQAEKAGYSPSDKIEWFPLMQAYVTLGQAENLNYFAEIIPGSPLVRRQACINLTASTSDPQMQAHVHKLFCE
jgi:hypothetical protein